ncbi:MAG: MmgE/PrpD family protein [Candidatus Rokubacteria bacterium]|nr:MmgE/PrpD family protein [Candidatus Rokubacteria bacterium]
MATAAETLAAYGAGLDPATLPAPVVHAARRCILDGVGVALAGAGTPWVERALAAARALGGDGPARVIGHAQRRPPALAALVNGTAVHALDYDDDPAACHIGAVVIPTALALGEVLGVPGRRILAAVVLGYDVTTRVADGIDADLLYHKGYHPTAVCGVFGAAATAAYLHGLDAERFADALGLAGSFAAGNMEFLADGAMSKRVQPGKAAHDGIVAAELARAGVTGPRTVLEGRYGLWRYTESLDAAAFTKGLGTRFAVTEVFVKKHASCLANAPAIDGVLELLQHAGVGPAGIAEIRVGLRPSSFAMVGEPRELRVRPQTMLDAQMSLPYSLAVAIVDGEAGIAQFAPERLRDPAVLALAERIHPYSHPELAGAKAGNLTSYVEITTSGSQHLARCFTTYRGHPELPMTDEELEAKFRRCAALRVPDSRVEAACRAIWRLDALPDLDPLLTAISG